MTDAVIRAARPADLPACAAIINAYIDATDWLPRARPVEEIAAMFSPDLLERRRVLVAEQGGTVVGYASLDPATEFLASLYLAPAAQGRGVGRQMLDRIKAEAPGGFVLNVWQPNTAARRFYGREGLAVAGESVDADGLPVWEMAWPGMCAPDLGAPA